jgi:hypothetical protein
VEADVSLVHFQAHFLRWRLAHKWVNRWDEWVPEQRLLKLNEAGFAKRRQLLDSQAKKGRPGATDSPAPSKGKEKGSSKKGEGSKKRGRDSGVDTVSFDFFSFLSVADVPRRSRTT